MENKEDPKIKIALQLFQNVVTDILVAEKEKGVAPHIPTDQLDKILDLKLSRKGSSEKEFRTALRELALATPKTAGNKFFNQLFGGRKAEAVLGDLLSVILNNSMYTYKAAGPQVAAEKEVIQNIIDLIGWDNAAAGTLAPGGSMANFMGLLMARDKIGLNIKNKGIKQTMRVYTSEESHYSTVKNASFSGIGRENVVNISCDDSGKMIPEALQKQIKEDLANGFLPVMVNATAGTTVLGAFDPLKPIHAICNEHNIWLHVDGAYCGAVLVSKAYKHLIEGIELADSFSFNAHKMLGTPLACSIIVTKEKDHLYHSFANEASYLYQTDHDEYNPGKISLQCGRRNDGLKLWALWKSIGTDGLEEMVDHQFDLAVTARNYIKSNSDYTLYSFDDSVSVCFNYKNISASTLCTLLYEHEELLVGYGAFQDNEFIRLVTINSNNNSEDILAFFKTLESFVANNSALFQHSQINAGA